MFKVGDKVKFHSHGGKGFPVGVVFRIQNNGDYQVSWDNGVSTVNDDTTLKHYVVEDEPLPVNPDGGPSSYYDFKPEYVTLNDIIEDKSEKQWLEHSFHLSNIMKACWRWGDKNGTTKEYDARKILYSAARILRKIAGTTTLRKELQRLLDDPQFQERK